MEVPAEGGLLMEIFWKRMGDEQTRPCDEWDGSKKSARSNRVMGCANVKRSQMMNCAQSSEVETWMGAGVVGEVDCISLTRRTDTVGTKRENRLGMRPVEIGGVGRARGPERNENRVVRAFKGSGG